MDEQEALTQLKQGNINGLEALVKLHGDKALRTAQLITRDSALAQDVVQDAFMRVFERFDQYDTARPFAPWFYRIVANLSLQALKRTQRFSSLSPIKSMSGRFDVEALIEQAESVEELEGALNSLPPDQRPTFVLRYYVGLSESETADKTDTPLGTVKWRLYRARERMKALLSVHAVDGRL